MRGRPAHLVRLLAIYPNPILVEYDKPLSTLTTFRKPKDITTLTKQDEQEHVTAGSDDRRQPDDAGEFLPAVTTVPIRLSELRLQQREASGGTWHSSSDALVLLEIAESVKDLQIEGWDFRSPTMDRVIAALRKVTAGGLR